MERYFVSLFIFCILRCGHQVKAANECSSNPCMNGATCVDGNYGYYTCQCATNWMGTNCEIAVEGANCGVNQYGSTGTLTSPNYPSDYQNNAHCLYLIRIHGATEIELNFTSFDTDSSLDRLIIGMGPTPTRSRRYTFSGTYSRTYSYRTNEIWMEFVTDNSMTSSGWSCTITADFSGCHCLNGGSCDNNKCSCVAGYDGALCEININECASVPCLNRGNCYDGTNRYSCSCLSGWYGTNCEYEYPKCLSNQCLNGGSCFVSSSRLYCRCQPGYSGSTCERDVNNCSPQPCLNGGTCNDGLNSYICDCLTGWTGFNCAEMDECVSSPCQNGGTCYDLFNKYLCVCVAGWHGDTCNEDINECSSHPCLNGGTCNDDINFYTCDCLPGWTGDNCQIGTRTSGNQDTGTLAGLVVLGVIMLLMIVAFIIFYKFCYLKNIDKGHDSKNPVVKYVGTNETVKPNAYVNQVAAVDPYTSLGPQTEDQLYEMPCPH